MSTKEEKPSSNPHQDSSPVTKSPSSDDDVTNSRLFNETSHIKSFYDFSTTQLRESDDEDMFGCDSITLQPPSRGPRSSDISASLRDFPSSTTSSRVILSERDRLSAPEFISAFESSESLNGLKKSVRMNYGLDDAKACLLLSQRHRVLQPLKKGPTNKEILNWIKARKLLSEEETSSSKEIKHLSDEEECNEDHLNKTVVLRVRQNSEDSLGSELSCSPPSPGDDAQSLVFSSPNTTPISRRPSSLSELAAATSGDEGDEVIPSSQSNNSSSTPQLSRSSILLRRKLLNSKYRKQFMSPGSSGGSSLVESQLIDAPSIRPAMPLDNLQDAHTVHRVSIE
ncbi:DNA polymerase [Caligus rogercresseyi]|uniref:DNA polymerase n=1 Tax=Caligus rogercresseyi TaxID=217165 RepID=A0A7T8KH02_CALRO|nr:DNA polymerase [Caligus rogercresseyi]